MQLSSLFLLLGLSTFTSWAHLLTPDEPRDVPPSVEDLSARAVPKTIKVQPWPGLAGSTKYDRTYYADLGVTFIVPTDADIITYAEKGYEYMMADLGLDNQGFLLSDSKKRGDKADYLMAALYIPKVGVFLCSIPQPVAKKYITANAATEAPALWSQIHNRTPAGSAHAEDGAAYRYEMGMKTKLAAGARYPEGSLIRVFGSFGGKKAEPQGLCQTGGKIDPACSPVFTNLGVAH
ncbi:hypothetical protein SEUCBS140593_006241 [Sporothrix eucalyptigena]|uniref:Uncharacterized protein n=1 Tax=Sporothrix eucalyptigena TaxID=1812306 RepID=A0ABP0C4C5_9PEZI